MSDHRDGREDDPFERAVAREQELRDQLENGERLTVDQVKRIVDEDIDPDLVRDVLDLHLTLTLDDILELIVNYEPDLEFFEQLRGVGRVERRDAEELLDNDVEPAAVARLRHAGLDVTLREAVRIVDEGGDLEDLADTIERHQLTELTADQICRLVSEGVELETVARLRDAELDLTLDDAIDLAAHGADPDVVARLAGSDDRMETADLKTAVMAGGPNISVGVNFRTGRTQQAWGAGRQRISQDGRMRGMWWGTMRVLPGVRTEIDGLVFGDLIVGQGAEVTVNGTVTGDIVNSGGHITINGHVRGGIVDE
jgi:hypothetical protein